MTARLVATDVVFSILKCEDCGEDHAVVPVGPADWWVWAMADVELLASPVEIAGNSPCCVKCGGELIMETDLAALSTSGRWINVGKTDPVFADGVMAN